MIILITYKLFNWNNYVCIDWNAQANVILSFTFCSGVNDWTYCIVSNFTLPIIYSTKIHSSANKFERLASTVYHLCIDQTDG
jgi:hypothetical protein